MLINEKVAPPIHIKPNKSKIQFIATNTAAIPMKSHSMVQGAIYGLFAQVDPYFTYKHHKTTDVKPWSHSLLKFHNKLERTERKGYYLVKRESQGYFFIKSIDSKIHSMLMDFTMKNKILHIGKLNLIIEEINTSFGKKLILPADIDTVEIRLDTPTFFYDHRNKKVEEFSGEIFIKYQCEKFNQLGIMNIDPEQLYPFLWILDDETKESWGYITNRLTNNEALPFKGYVGKIKFKVVGNTFEKSLIWKLIYLSEYTGIGTRTSMGFGHNTLMNFTYE